jgi:hypothetical protein
MILYLFLALMNVSYADPSWKWANAIKIVDKHEFYTNNEIIQRPKSSWQTLFGVLYHDSNLKTLKDCVYYKVPGDGEAGTLKLKTVAADKACEEFLFSPGDQEWKNLKAVQYNLTDRLLSVSITNAKFEIEKWEVPLFNVFENPEPKLLMSSAEYRSPPVMYLTPYKGVATIHPVKGEALIDKKLCHDVNEICEEKSPSVCSQCSNGWYEIPNGCAQGPKYCGDLGCGQKAQPACRRGMKYQRVEKIYNCTEDSSFAYCAKGFSVQCQGNLPYCF